MKIGKYNLIEKIAEGGMAELWLAKQQGPAGFSRTVAIKRILPNLVEDERFVEMFLDEARLAAQLTHPNIVQIHDFGESDGDFFLAMEFVRGRSLDRVVALQRKRGGSLPLEVAAYVLSQACVGLDHAHKFTDPETRAPLNLVHRDVSPQNLMISFDGLVKVMDFGIAKAATSEVKTQTGAVKGKYAYMSPEQIAGQSLDARSDVFALGIVLYELIAGVRPFGTESDLVAVTAILNEPPKPIRDQLPDCPDELEAILNKALEKDRRDRFADAHAMQVDLERYLRAIDKVMGARDLAAYMLGLYGEIATAPLRTSPGQAGAEAPLGPEPPKAAQISGLEGTVAGSPGPPEARGRADTVPEPATTSEPVATVPSAPNISVTATTADEIPTFITAAPSASRPATSDHAGGGAGALILMLVVVAVGVVGAGAYLIISNMGADKAPPPVATAAPAPPQAPAAAKPAAAKPAAAKPTPEGELDDATRATIEAGMLAGLPTGMGVLVIHAERGVSVSLDGRPLGTAPIDPLPVKAGKHEVRGVLRGGAIWEGTVTVPDKAKASVGIR